MSNIIFDGNFKSRTDFYRSEQWPSNAHWIFERRLRFFCRGECRRGAALVEFAFILPVILLIFCAILEFSHVSLMRHSADAAAYEACRSAIVVGATTGDAELAAKKLLLAASIREWSVEVQPEAIDETTSRVKVTVQIPVKDNSWITPFFLREKVVERSVSLITERPSNVQLTGLPTQQQLLGVNALGLGL